MIEAVGFRVVIKPDPIEEVSEGGIVLYTSDDSKVRDKVAQTSGVVVAVGPTAWHSFDRYLPSGELNPSWVPWAAVGDRVVYSKYGGKFVTDPETEDEYVIINDNDVNAVLRTDHQIKEVE